MTTRLSEGGPSIDLCMCSKLRQTTRVMTQFYDKALKPSGVRATQFPILAAISKRGPMTILGLAEVLVIDRTTLTRNLHLLEKKGWLIIKPGNDKRSRVIQLTSEGGKRLKMAIKYWFEAQDELEKRMGESKFDRLLKELSRTTELAQA